MNNKFIPLSVPNFQGNERKYVDSAVTSEWVSTGGSFVSDFEKALADYVKMPMAVATSNGTSALHLSMLISGIGEGDEVIAPALTFIAAINPIRYAGAQPVFVDCDDYLCMDPASVLQFLQEKCEKVGDRTINKTTGAHVKAILPVHVFGNLCQMEEIIDIAKEYNLIVIEDATEALGSYFLEGRYKNKHAGTIGDVGCYSFNGNKIITTGGGGMLVSNHNDWAIHAKHLSTQAKSDELRFYHDEIGYNYRMTNLQAALGVAQLETLEDFIDIKHRNYDIYKDMLNGVKGFKILPFRQDVRNNKWFYSLMLEDCSLTTDEVIKALSEEKIQSRPIWALISDLKPYENSQRTTLENAKKYWKGVVNLPCSTNLSAEDAKMVAQAVLDIIK